MNADGLIPIGVHRRLSAVAFFCYASSIMRKFALPFLILILIALPIHAADYDASLFGSLHWRNIGPQRGGRSIASAGSAQRPNEYYFGATGGGLWKTTDG